MIARRCIYFILSVWLINTIVCFHGYKNFGDFPEHLQYPGENCSKGSSAFEYFGEVLTSDDSDTDPSQHPLKRPSRKLLVRRAAAESYMQIPSLLDFIKSNLAIDINCTFGKQWFSKAFLPGYYNFLFRLKPF